MDSVLNVEAQRLSDLSRQVLEAENRRKGAQAVYLTAKNSTDVLSIPEVQKSGRITNIQERISALKERKSTLEVTYTKEWPEVKRQKPLSSASRRSWKNLPPKPSPC